MVLPVQPWILKCGKHFLRLTLQEETQASLGLHVCHISHSCVFCVYLSPFHSAPTIPWPLPIRFQTLTDSVWESEVAAGWCKAHCYPACPYNGEVYPSGQNINWSMHSRSGSFVVSGVICMLVGGTHTWSSTAWGFFFNVLSLLALPNFPLYFGVFWEKSHKTFRWAFSNFLFWALFLVS